MCKDFINGDPCMTESREGVKAGRPDRLMWIWPSVEQGKEVGWESSKKLKPSCQILLEPQLPSSSHMSPRNVSALQSCCIQLLGRIHHRPRWLSVKNLPERAEDETDAGSIPGSGISPEEDSLEKEMATCSSISPV